MVAYQLGERSGGRAPDSAAEGGFPMPDGAVRIDRNPGTTAPEAYGEAGARAKARLSFEGACIMPATPLPSTPSSGRPAFLTPAWARALSRGSTDLLTMVSGEANGRAPIGSSSGQSGLAERRSEEHTSELQAP